MRVALTGATGFVGRSIVDELLARGHHLTVLARDPGAARLRWSSRLKIFAGNVLDARSLAPAFQGQEAVIHLVGIIHEKGGRSFDEVHRRGTQNVVLSAGKAGVRKYLHMSAMGASPCAPSRYGRSKAAGEDAVRQSPMEWTILRPSVIFGPGDGFVTLLANVIRRSPGFMPVIGPGTVRFMPVSVHEVARVFTDALQMPEITQKSFEVGGPEVLTLNQIQREIASALGKKGKPAVHLPLWWGRALAGALELFPHPPLTRDQLKSMKSDNIADTSETTRFFGPFTDDFREGIRRYITPARDASF